MTSFIEVICLDKQYDGSYIFGLTIIYTGIYIFIVWFCLPNVSFLMCDVFAIFILNLLTSTYSSRQSVPPLSSYKLFNFLTIPPVWKVDMRMLQQHSVRC